MARRYSSEVKAQATADLIAGMTVKEVAAKYGMARSTVGDLSPGSTRGALKIRRIADLKDLEVAFRSQLAHNFAAMEAITRTVIEDDDWRTKQSAEELGSLSTTLFRQSTKLLGALYGPSVPAIDIDTSDDADAP